MGIELTIDGVELSQSGRMLAATSDLRFCANDQARAIIREVHGINDHVVPAAICKDGVCALTWKPIRK